MEVIAEDDIMSLNPSVALLFRGAFHVVSDPFRRPQDLYASIISPIGSFIDKAKVRRSSAQNYVHETCCSCEIAGEIYFLLYLIPTNLYWHRWEYTQSLSSSGRKLTSLQGKK